MTTTITTTTTARTDWAARLRGLCPRHRVDTQLGQVDSVVKVHWTNWQSPTKFDKSKVKQNVEQRTTRVRIEMEIEMEIEIKNWNRKLKIEIEIENELWHGVHSSLHFRLATRRSSWHWSQFAVHGSQFTVRSSQITVHDWQIVNTLRWLSDSAIKQVDWTAFFCFALLFFLFFIYEWSKSERQLPDRSILLCTVSILGFFCDPLQERKEQQ